MEGLRGGGGRRALGASRGLGGGVPGRRPAPRPEGLGVGVDGRSLGCGSHGTEAPAGSGPQHRPHASRDQQARCPEPAGGDREH